MKKIIFFHLVFFCLHVNAQPCGNCDNKPVISLYDLDIQLEIPKIEGGDSTNYLKWVHLGGLTGLIEEQLKKKEKCAYIFELGMEGEEVREEGKIPRLGPSKSFEYGYRIMGYVKPVNNEHVLLHLVLESACNRKAVAETQIVFEPSTDDADLRPFVQSAVQKLTPLTEKIKNFELRERNETKEYALRGDLGEKISIKPGKKNLKAGETTEVTIELKDCDEVPLPGRAIEFGSKKMWYGGTIPETIGGIMTPTQVTTDAQGKAKANFKMTAPLGQPAIINAHAMTRSYISCAVLLPAAQK